MGIIYRHEINGKSYVGYTKGTIRGRLYTHLLCVDKGIKSHFYNSIRKYGQENIISEILEECDNELLSEREKFWIQKLDTFNNGLNMTTGGDGGATRIGQKNSAEHRRRSSETQTGGKKRPGNKCGQYKKSQDQRRKISESVSQEMWMSNDVHTIKIKSCNEQDYLKNGYTRGRTFHNFGPVKGCEGPSEEQRRRISQTLRNKPIVVCPHCGKSGKGGAMKRYHFNNCKMGVKNNDTD